MTTPRMRRACLVMAVVAVACSSTGARAGRAGSAMPTTTATEAPKPVSVSAAALDVIAGRYRNSCRSPGAAIGVRTHDGADHYAVSGRFAPGVALERDSQFLAGSVTKLFVATVAYQLIAQRKLALGDTVDKYLPTWPRGKRITVAMLLGHRSGMGDFGNDFSAQLRELVLANLRRAYSYDEVLDLVRAVPPIGQPGAQYHYSNANYIVLGAIVQRVTGQSLGRLVRDRILRPLGLTRTLYGPDDLASAEAVVFHGWFDVTGRGVPVDIGAFPRTAALTVDPAGAGLFSSLPDLLQFTRALFATDRFLAAPQRAALARSVSTLDARALLLDDRFSIDGHGGASPGAQTIVAYDARHDLTVAVWCNRLDPGAAELAPSIVAARQTFVLAAGP